MQTQDVEQRTVEALRRQAAAMLDEYTKRSSEVGLEGAVVGDHGRVAAVKNWPPGFGPGAALGD